MVLTHYHSEIPCVLAHEFRNTGVKYWIVLTLCRAVNRVISREGAGSCCFNELAWQALVG